MSDPAAEPAPDPASEPASEHDRRAPSVVVGADVGGTSTRVAVATITGDVLAVETGPGANPSGGDPLEAAERIATLCLAALGAAADRVGATVRPRAAVVGLAGVTTVRATPAAERFVTVVPGVRALLVSDLVIAHASATWRQHGVVSISGTGAAAMEVDGSSEIGRRDGWGWLLGDEGSGYWLGREAVRAALRHLERGEADSALTTAVLDALAVGPGPDGAEPSDRAAALVRAAYARPPRELSRLAPLVSAHASTDPDAAVILEQAATLTAERALDVLAGRRDLPVVLTGSLVTGDGPLAAPVGDLLARAGVSQVLAAGDGLLGSLWLATTAVRDADPVKTDMPPTPDAHWSHLLGSLTRYR